MNGTSVLFDIAGTGGGRVCQAAGDRAQDGAPIGAAHAAASGGLMEAGFGWWMGLHERKNKFGFLISFSYFCRVVSAHAHTRLRALA